MTGRGASVILAAGDFPRRGGTAWRLLSAARRIIACDSAAVACRRRLGRWPDVIVGDMDSIPRPVAKRPEVAARIVPLADQDTNDLSKAVGYCRARGWGKLVVVGAGGRREDHLIGNVFRSLEAQIPLVTDSGAFHPVCGRASFRFPKGTAVSIFAPDPKTRMTSSGLEWPLAGVRFANLYCATLNRTCAARVTVSSSKPVYLFEAFPQG